MNRDTPKKDSIPAPNANFQISIKKKKKSCRYNFYHVLQKIANTLQDPN